MKLTALNSTDAKLLASIATHESGHLIVASAYGLRPKAFIGGPRSAIVKHDHCTLFELAAISWAGVLAEDLTANRYPDRTLPACELARGNLTGWIAAMIAGGLTELKAYSSPDVAGIASHPCTFETARAAFQILTANLDLLREFAGELADESWLRFRLNENDFANAERLCALAQ